VQEALAASLETLLEVHEFAFSPQWEPLSEDPGPVPLPSLERFGSLRAVTVSLLLGDPPEGPICPALPASVQTLVLHAGGRCAAESFGLSRRGHQCLLMYVLSPTLATKAAA